MSWLSTVRKALVAGVSAAFAVLVDAQAHGGITQSSIELAIGALVLVAFMTWLAPNAAKAVHSGV